MKKSRVLRNWVISGLVGMFVTLIVLGLGVWFRDTAGIVGNQFVNGTNLCSIAWLPVISNDYWNGFLADAFTAFFGASGLGNWSDYHYIVDNIVWIFIAILGLVLFIAILVKAIKRKSGKHIGFAFFFLIFALISVACTTAYYFARHLEYSYVNGVLTFDGLKAFITNSDNSTVFHSMLNALMGKGIVWDNLANTWQVLVVTILAWVLCLAALLYIITYLGMSITALVQLRKRKEVVVEEAAPVVETEPQPEPTPVPEKKKGILVVKRYDKYGDYGPLVEAGEIDYPKKGVTAKPLTVEEVRKVIQEEIEKAETRRIVEEYKNQKQAEAVAKVLSRNQAPVAPVTTPTVTKSVEGKEDESKVYPTPIIFAMPTSVKEEGVSDSETKPVAAPKKENKGLTEDQVKEIIASEIKDALKDFVIKHEKVVEKHVEVKVPAKEEPVAETVEFVEAGSEVKEETAPVVEETKVEETSSETTPVAETVAETKPVEEEKVVEETTVETPTTETTAETAAPVEETKVEETTVEPVEAEEETKEEAPATEPVAEQKTEEVVPEAAQETPVVEETKVEETSSETTPVTETAPVVETPVVTPVTTEEKPKIIRIPFTTRMLEADDELKAAYNHIKSLLKSYGLNNRVANGGDSFRLHRVTYCKITIAGKSLKLYLALDPKDYTDTTYPIKDASSKNIYKETPLVFKVRSGLSLRRADELIRDCMDKHGLEQIDQVQEHDWASELANVSVEDDGSEADED